ncbi:hypothetical protein BH11PSE5_BH11PSE5_01240 [soil metagenome]|jgi:hypothetical protein|uniref:hypothetical protein n=1 Tax=unclassified Sphingobium TaxID=2611147 RepID=UPI001E62AFAF|nr:MULTISPECIES: hypothetical protein [unclassified Sphingobium]GLJ00311.1 hypothetical protein Sbs19_41280 [Sphingobium sp. BS19]CAH0348932.1 hypothetical protein SPH9361_00350 [Sphingobium sp. CECT 9361]|tara:strand:- start:917 stop:1090 length:174 start_codon:yes stop_codon:yes gene_type:complete
MTAHISADSHSHGTPSANVVMCESGPLDRRAAAVQMYILPVLILIWTIAVMVIVAMI